MKTLLRKNLALFLVLCMCISLCPITAFAGTETVTVEAVTATAQPLNSTTHAPVTLTTASVFPSEHYFYVKFDGLAAGDYYQIIVQTDTDSEYRYLYVGSDEPVVESMYYNLPLGNNTVTLTICDDTAKALYQPVTLTTQVAESIPMAAEDLQAIAEPTEVSNLETSIYVSTCLPVGTITGNETLSLELVKNDVVYATTTEDSYCNAYPNNLWDTRYTEILDEDTYVPLRVQQVRSYVYCGRELAEGSYDVRLYADGELITTHKNAVVCHSTPIVSGRIFSSLLGTHNVIGSEMAGITLDITNGDPADFAVELYLEGEKVAESTGYRVMSASVTDCSAVYYIPLNEPMEQNQEYEYRVKYAKEGDFILSSSDLSKRIYEKVAADRETIQFGSYYYANFTLPSFGYDAGVQYKFELSSFNDVLATTYASPNNDGFFNLEFRDEDDQLIELERNTSYDITFYGNLDNPSYRSCSWSLYNQYLRREAATNLMSAGETFVLNVESANFSQDSSEWITVQMFGGDAADVYNENADYQLRLSSVTGEEYLLDVETADLYDDGYIAEIGFSIPAELDNAYYHVELLYDGKLVVTESGENIFIYGDLLSFSRQARVGVARGRSREVSAIIGLNPRSLGGKDLTVELFSLLNDTTEPDYTLTLTEDNDYAITNDDMAKLNPAVKYKAVISAEGKVLNVTDYVYCVSEEAMHTSYDDFGTATVAEGMEDYLEIVPCYTNYNAEEGIPCFSEVYVNVTAPEGKALQYITVNGEKICGNGFLFTEDCEVSAIFAEPETETYKATVQMGTEEWVYSNGMTEAELDEYLETLSPEEQEAFWANGGGENGSWVFTALYSYELNLPPNSMQELDLTLPANLRNYKVGNIDVECADPDQWASVSHDGTETHWFLDMPECDVVVTVELEEKRSYGVSVSYDSSLGTVAGLESDYVSVTEGETVSFTAAPTEGNLLNEVYYEYYGYQGGSYGTHKVTLTPGANGVYSFVMPDTHVYLYAVFTTSGPYTVKTYSYGLGSVSVSESASAEGYMAGEMVTLTVIPNEGSRLTKKNGIQGGYSLGYEYCNVEFTKVNDTTYTFVMPHGNVTIEVFYEIAPAIAPGGTVVDNDTLIAALGGAENAALNAETGAVQLLQNVELQSPILFNPTVVTEFILDLNGCRIIAVEENTEESGAIILHQNGLAHLTLDSTKDDAVITTDGLPRNHFHLIWVRGGKLTLAPQEYIFFYTAYSYYENSSAGIRVTGGVVELVDNFEVHGNGTGEALWASGGTTTVRGGSYFGGVDYDDQLAGELNLLGGLEDYDWVTSRSLGGSAIRVSGRAKVDLLGESLWATGGPNGAALHIDNKVSVDTPCEVNVYEGSYYGEYGKGLLVESAYANLIVHCGEFYAGYPSNADYSVDVRNCGVVADYLAPDRKVENLDRYLGYENGENIYEEMTEEDLQSSYLYYDIRVSDGPVTLTNAELDKVLAELPETITPEDVTNIQNAVSDMTDLADALEKDTPDSSSGTTEKLAQVEALIGEVTVEIENETFQIDGAEASITGAVINAGGDVTLNVGQAQVENKETLPDECQNAQHFSLELTVNGEEVTLSTPVKVVLPIPANVNPALLMILHYNEQDQEWESITPTVYQVGDQWYVTFVAGSFSDFALAHNVSILKDSNNGGIWVTLNTHQNAAENQRFLCAIYSEQGQMLSSAMINDTAFIKLGIQYYSAYEVKVFATEANDSWAPKYGADTIPLM